MKLISWCYKTYNLLIKILYRNLIIKSLEISGKLFRLLVEFWKWATISMFFPCTTMYFVAKIIENTKSRNQFNFFEWMRIRICKIFKVQQKISSALEQDYFRNQ